MFERFFDARDRASGRARRATATAWTTALGAAAALGAWGVARDARAMDAIARWRDGSTTARGDGDGETALRDEMARVDAIANGVTTPGVARGVREATRRATRGERGTEVGTARAPSEALAEACATLAATSACALVVKTAMNLIGRRGFLDRERRGGGGDAGRRVAGGVSARDDDGFRAARRGRVGGDRARDRGAGAASV